VGPASLGDTASGRFPPTALGRYTEPDDSFAQTQTRFWISASKRGRNFDSGSEISERSARSPVTQYFTYRPTGSSIAVGSTGTQVERSPWTLMASGPIQSFTRPRPGPGAFTVHEAQDSSTKDSCGYHPYRDVSLPKTHQPGHGRYFSVTGWVTFMLVLCAYTVKKSSEFEFTFTLIRVRQRHSQTRSSRQLVLYPTDPWLRSHPPTRPYFRQGPISVQPRDAMATANPCYRRGLAVASGRAHRDALWEVSPSSSLVGR